MTARRKRNQGRLAKLKERRATRAAMLGPAGTAKLGLDNDDNKTNTVIDAEKADEALRRKSHRPRLHPSNPAR